MGLFDAMNVAATGLTGERLRMDTIAANLANANSTRRADGQPGPYLRREVVLQRGVADARPARLRASRPSATSPRRPRSGGVAIAGIVEQTGRHGPDPRPVAPRRRRERQRAHAERQHRRRDDRPDHRDPRVRGQHDLDQRRSRPSSRAPWTCCADGRHRTDRRRRGRRHLAVPVAAQRRRRLGRTRSAAPATQGFGDLIASKLQGAVEMQDTGAKASQALATGTATDISRGDRRRREGGDRAPAHCGVPEQGRRGLPGRHADADLTGDPGADSRHRRRSARHGLPPDRRRRSRWSRSASIFYIVTSAGGAALHAGLHEPRRAQRGRSAVGAGRRRHPVEAGRRRRDRAGAVEQGRTRRAWRPARPASARARPTGRCSTSRRCRRPTAQWQMKVQRVRSELLASQIEDIAGVCRATVNLAIPERSVFSADQDQPHASVTRRHLRRRAHRHRRARHRRAGRRRHPRPGRRRTWRSSTRTGHSLSNASSAIGVADGRRDGRRAAPGRAAQSGDRADRARPAWSASGNGSAIVAGELNFDETTEKTQTFGGQKGAITGLQGEREADAERRRERRRRRHLREHPRRRRSRTAAASSDYTHDKGTATNAIDTTQTDDQEGRAARRIKMSVSVVVSKKALEERHQGRLDEPDEPGRGHEDRAGHDRERGRLRHDEHAEQDRGVRRRRPPERRAVAEGGGRAGRSAGPAAVAARPHSAG